ncbi:MAG: DUF4062 domain-containing protein [Bacteroidaceae bacterium]|nr:DUF4062 domain-containing protein [Bacteroidaceae bacterium]
MSSGVYVSSTSADLAEHREAVKAVIPTLSSAENFAEFRYIGLEYRTADARPSIESIYSAIDDAEYVVVLVGWRYGTVPSGTDKSVVEMEYERAAEHDKIVLCYVIEDDYPISPKLVERGIGAECLQRFKNRLKKERVVSTFSSPDDLARKVAVDLTRTYKTTMREAVEHAIARPKLESQLRQCEKNNQRLTETIDYLRTRIENIVPAEPIWNTRNFKVDSSLCFVLMPFADEFYKVYEQAISVAAENAGLRCLHAGEIFDNREIVEDIWESICTAQVIVADVTNRNPNVFYELGICHTIGKEVIIITQKNEDVPFDIRHRRYIDYSPKALTTLRSRLEKTIKRVVVRMSDNNDNENA